MTRPLSISLLIAGTTVGLLVLGLAGVRPAEAQMAQGTRTGTCGGPNQPPCAVSNLPSANYQRPRSARTWEALSAESAKSDDDAEER